MCDNQNFYFIFVTFYKDHQFIPLVNYLIYKVKHRFLLD